MIAGKEDRKDEGRKLVISMGKNYWFQLEVTSLLLTQALNDTYHMTWAGIYGPGC